MDAAPTESLTFLHRVVRWLAILVMAYGLLDAVSLIAFAVAGDFPFYRHFVRSELVAAALSVLLFASIALMLAGAWGLVRWRSWGRVMLIVWSVLAILLGLTQAIVSTSFYIREFASTTQPVRPSVGLMVWNLFYQWLTTSALPIVSLVILRQPEVAGLWAGPRHSGGFDVIPIATAADPMEAVR